MNSVFYVLLHFEHKNEITIIIKLHRTTHLRPVALFYLTMIVTSFYVQNIGIHGIPAN